jgi:predicted RND superfamily exporter protein
MPRPSTVSGKNRWLTFIVDHPYHILPTAFIITLLFAWQLPKLQFQTSIYDLAVEDISETVRYESFKKEFGTDAIIFVVANTENIFEPATFQRIEVLAQALAEVNGIRRVISLPGIRKDMDLTERWNLADFEKLVAPVELFQRNLISADKKKTIITALSLPNRNAPRFKGSSRVHRERFSPSPSHYLFTHGLYLVLSLP